jgi:hypothetical protein
MSTVQPTLALYVLALLIGFAVAFLLWVLYQLHLESNRRRRPRPAREPRAAKQEAAERKSRKGTYAPSRLEWYSGR